MKNLSSILKAAHQFEQQSQIDKLFLQKKIEKLDFDPDQLEQVRNIISSLKEEYDPNQIDKLVKAILFTYDDKDSILKMIKSLKNKKRVEELLNFSDSSFIAFKD